MAALVPARPRRTFALLFCVGLVLLASPLATSAKPALHHGKGAPGRVGARYISGRVNVSGYTVLAVGYNGRIASSSGPSFRIAAPDTKVTLQLVSSHGRYAGPVVLGGSAARAITGLKAPANVGTIDVIPAQGYARLAHALSRRDLDSSRWAYAKHGVPLGNGRNLGLVFSQGRGGGSGAGQDQARVGIPNELDVAVPGTRILRSLAPLALARRASLASVGDPRAYAAAESPSQPAPGGNPPTPPTTPPAGGPKPPGGPPPSGPAPSGPPAGGPAPEGGPAPSASSPWMAQLFLAMNETINDDASGVTAAEIDSTLQSKLNLKLLNVPTGAGPVELNCNGLSFCSQGGTGQAQLEGLPLAPGGASGAVPFPSGSLDQATGFGELVGPAVPSGLLGNDASGGHEFSLDPNATSSQIGSGDVITEVIGEGPAASQLPTTIDFVFNTVPAIASYSDTAGDSATIAYPDTSNLGTTENPLKVAAGSGGDVVVTFTLYRPQRQGVAGASEPAFMDIGHLGYELDYASAPAPGSTTVGSTNAPQCPASAYSNPSSTLSLESGGSGEHAPPPGAGEMIDSAEDHPASASDTISFTVDLTQCLAAKGVASFPVGQPVQFDISANSQSSSDHSNQTFSVQRTH